MSNAEAELLKPGVIATERFKRKRTSEDQNLALGADSYQIGALQERGTPPAETFPHVFPFTAFL